MGVRTDLKRAASTTCYFFRSGDYGGVKIKSINLPAYLGEHKVVLVSRARISWVHKSKVDELAGEPTAPVFDFGCAICLGGIPSLGFATFK